MTAKGIQCFGKVQGVFFRANTKSIAENLELVGWVRNEADGSVRIHAEGDATAVEELCEWCKRGPEFASVTQAKIWDEKAEGFPSFEIRR